MPCLFACKVWGGSTSQVLNHIVLENNATLISEDVVVRRKTLIVEPLDEICGSHWQVQVANAMEVL